MPPPYPAITVPQTPAQIEAALADLAASFPALCTLDRFPNKSVEGRDIHFIKIANGSGSNRPVVVLIGGVHARESAPPDALIRFAQSVLVSHDGSSDITFPAMSCEPLPSGPAVAYPDFTILASDVKKIVDTVDLYIAPLINPDGRLFDQLHPPSPPSGGWRKNRRPHPDPAKIGVDLNRNHDIAWKFEDYYDMALYRADYPTGPAEAVDESEETYRGPSVASEPETANVQWIVDTKKPAFFVDIHQFGRKVLMPWGLEDNGDDPTMTFSSPAWTGKRDGLRPGSLSLPPTDPDYKEFVSDSAPHFVKKNLGFIGDSMRDAILASAGVVLGSTAPDPKRDHSTFEVAQAAVLYHPVGGGPVTGTTHDYAFRKQFDDPARAPVFAFGIESGHEEEAGFHPDYASPPGHYAKIEREIHAALIALGTIAAKLGKPCLVATATMGTPDHPDVVTLRRFRDAWLGPRFDRCYYRVSPPVARYLLAHPWARAAVRHGLVGPAAALLRTFPESATRAPGRTPPERTAAGRTD
ncbi:M14 family zinc carboxypeptidase [Kitasatospora sp. KL5]|uniref:M14 family zinc carboxypeptidase n=1 Tax=Kitasatospora sp. KL5 TaxID=3425125 RepID=UPI003D6FE516